MFESQNSKHNASNVNRNLREFYKTKCRKWYSIKIIEYFDGSMEIPALADIFFLLVASYVRNLIFRLIDFMAVLPCRYLGKKCVYNAIKMISIIFQQESVSAFSCTSPFLRFRVSDAKVSVELWINSVKKYDLYNGYVERRHVQNIFRICFRSLKSKCVIYARFKIFTEWSFPFLFYVYKKIYAHCLYKLYFDGNKTENASYNFKLSSRKNLTSLKSASLLC